MVKQKETAPICFALLPKQNQPNFRIVFHKLKEILASFYGDEKRIYSLVTDFGLAAVQAVVSVIQNGLSVVSCTLNLSYTNRELSTLNSVQIVNVLTLFPPQSLLLVWNRFQYDPIRLHLELPEKIK
uniref:Uncharacterized protein n=1 Tax=Romanomermis culicivorax TaxID=13658 RepID=A0A915JH19_ROMCU